MKITKNIVLVIEGMQIEADIPDHQMKSYLAQYNAASIQDLNMAEALLLVQMLYQALIINLSVSNQFISFGGNYAKN